MANLLRLTFRFLQPRSHGRGDGGEPEWPPSPLRAFQALTAAAAAHWNERTKIVTGTPMLSWLEQLAPPTIIAAPAAKSDTKYRLYVPNNIGDKIAQAWSAHRESSVPTRTEKDVRSINLCGDGAVHYLWPLAEADVAACERHLDVLRAGARSVTHLGWGVDMATGDAGLHSDDEAAALVGERWLPGADGTALRVPIRGTLEALVRKHEQFLDRLGDEGFKPVAPLSAFRTVGYRRSTDVTQPPFAAFQFLKPDSSDFRSFDPLRQTMSVAGMLRHAASGHWDKLGFESENDAGFLHGHGEARGEEHRAPSGPRLAYLPLPSLEYRGNAGGFVVGRIRRALLTVVGGRAEVLLRQTSRLLSSSPLNNERTGKEEAILSPLPHTDKMIQRYVGAASAWSTVTPVILPGYDDPRKLRRKLFVGGSEMERCRDAEEQKTLLDKLDRRIDFLLRKTIRQAGYSDELATNADIEWRSIGFRAGTAPAAGYSIPNKLRRYRRLHVRIRWNDPSGDPIIVSGPICLGTGRFIGLGLFAADTD